MAHLFIMQAAAAVKEDSPAATKEASKFAIGCLNTSRLNNMMRGGATARHTQGGGAGPRSVAVELRQRNL